MTGCAFLAVPGFPCVPEGVQERTRSASIVFDPFRGETWSQITTIVPDSYLPDQERPGQERKKARVSAGLPFLIPGVPEKMAGTSLALYFNALAPVPGFLPSLKRGRRFRNRPSLTHWRGKEWAPQRQTEATLARQL
jgi:hypothetical protein